MGSTGSATSSSASCSPPPPTSCAARDSTSAPPARPPLKAARTRAAACRRRSSSVAVCASVSAAQGQEGGACGRPAGLPGGEQQHVRQPGSTRGHRAQVRIGPACSCRAHAPRRHGLSPCPGSRMPISSSSRRSAGDAACRSTSAFSLQGPGGHGTSTRASPPAHLRVRWLRWRPCRHPRSTVLQHD